MIGRSFRNQSIIVVSFIVALTLLSTILISQGAYLSSIKTQTYQLLESHNEYITILLNQSPELHFSILDTYSTAHSIRITLLDRNGKVAYDSNYDEEDLENHIFREEVQSSLKNGIGMSERKSDTQGVLVLYLSQFDESSVYPIIRTSTPLHQIKSYRTLFNKLLFGSISVLIFIIFTLTIVSIKKITKPLEDVNALAYQYSKGNLKAKMNISGPSEISELTYSLTSMASKLKKTIDELNTSRSMIETMINSVSQGLLLLDDNLTIRIANTSSYELLPSNQKLEGHSISEIINSTQVIETIRQCRESNKHTEILIEQYTHLYGETAKIVGKEKVRTLRFAIDPIHDESTTMALVITITDMSEIVKLEQMKRDFVANVSHELKTPITAIAGFSQTLLDEEKEQLNSTQLKFLSIIHRQGQNMLSIVQDLLLLSSLEQEQTHLTYSWVDIEHVIEQSVTSCRYRAKEKEIGIENTITNVENLPVFIHPVLIGQALTNLLTNAIVYSPPQSRVRVETFVNENELIIKVIDSGYGVPVDELERIFERFYRVDTARSRSSGGTGLGLSIVKHIAHVHHGNVSVTSSIDVGSTFTLTVDRKDGEFSQLEKSRQRIME